jgi:hypothetical protein
VNRLVVVYMHVWFCESICRCICRWVIGIVDVSEYAQVYPCVHARLCVDMCASVYVYFSPCLCLY